MGTEPGPEFLKCSQRNRLHLPLLLLLLFTLSFPRKHKALYNRDIFPYTCDLLYQNRFESTDYLANSLPTDPFYLKLSFTKTGSYVILVVI